MAFPYASATLNATVSAMAASVFPTPVGPEMTIRAGFSGMTLPIYIKGVDFFKESRRFVV